MKVKDAIESRRSIRKFLEKEIPDSVVLQLIESACLAPSAYNAQPWRFVIIKSKEQKELLKQNNIFKQPFVYKAPVIIVCLADADVFPKERFENTFSNASEIGGQVGAVRDISIASQNLVLQATELGLGTCYIGLVDREKLKEIFKIPKDFALPFVIILGYPAESPAPALRKKTKEIILQNNLI